MNNMTEEEIKAHIEEECAKLRKNLEEKLIKPDLPEVGELCWFWDVDSHKKLCAYKFKSYSDGIYYTVCPDGVSDIGYKHCEPVNKKLGVTLWLACDSDGMVEIYGKKPVKSKSKSKLCKIWDYPAKYITEKKLFLNPLCSRFGTPKWEDDEPIKIEI